MIGYDEANGCCRVVQVVHGTNGGIRGGRKILIPVERRQDPGDLPVCCPGTGRHTLVVRPMKNNKVDISGAALSDDPVAFEPR